MYARKALFVAILMSNTPLPFLYPLMHLYHVISTYYIDSLKHTVITLEHSRTAMIYYRCTVMCCTVICCT